MAQKIYTLRLLSAEKISPSVKHFVFEREDGEVPSFQAGQFITLHIPTPEGKKAFRSYSVANAPAQNNRLELSLAYVKGGLASELLFNLKPMETLQAMGPHGLFVLKPNEAPKRYILVATGTGVTPYRSMLSDLAHRLRQNPDLQVHLILGVRTEEDAIFKSEFLAFAERFSGFQVSFVYSRLKTVENTPVDKAFFGYVQDRLASLAPNPDEDIVYLCGNPSMIDVNFALLTETWGFDRKQVRREKYTFSH